MIVGFSGKKGGKIHLFPLITFGILTVAIVIGTAAVKRNTETRSRAAETLQCFSPAFLLTSGPNTGKCQCPAGYGNKIVSVNEPCLASKIYDLKEEKISFGGVVFANMDAGPYDPTKVAAWNKYAYNAVIEAEGTALKNVYATELMRQKDGKWRIFYGGWNTDDPKFTADRIHTAVSTNFIFKNAQDFSPPTWTDRKVVISNNGDVVANDPTIVEYAPSQYVMQFSRSAPPVNGVKVSDTISFSVSNNLIDWLYTKPDSNNAVTVYGGQSGGKVEFLHRPSLVYDNGTFYLYYDQGGYPKATKNNGFTIRVAKGPAGQFFGDVGEVFPPGSPENGYAGAPEVEKFPNGWIMFYDRHLNALAYATSNDGLQFADKGKLVEDPETTITNVNIIRKDDRLLGVLFGAFPKLKTVSSCQYPTGDYCLSNGKVNAYFLQKKVVFKTDDGRVWNQSVALDENRSELKTALSSNGSATGTVEIYDTDGKILLLSKRLTIRPGSMYTLIDTTSSISCEIRGYKIDARLQLCTGSNCDGASPVSLDNKSVSVTNPYVFRGVPYGLHTISVNLPPEKTKYSVCNNCIDHPTQSFIAGNQTVAVCDRNGYIDLYWQL